MTARAQCECCDRVRKATLKVVKCKRCGKHVCVSPNCQVPHALGVCGDKFANDKARAIANDLPPRSFAPKDAFDPVGFDGATLVNVGGTDVRLTHPEDAKVTFVRIEGKQC